VRTGEHHALPAIESAAESKLRLMDRGARRKMGYTPPTSIDDGLKALAVSQ